MSYTLNAITAPDTYTKAATIENVPVGHINLDVANQPIYWQLKIAIGSTGNWDSTEVYMLPGSRSISRAGIAGIRVRAAVKAANIPAGKNQAVVTVEVV